MDACPSSNRICSNSPPDLPAFIHRPEDLAFRNFRGRDPRVDPDLHRGGYGHRAPPVPFSHQVRYDPAALALLDPVDFEGDELGASGALQHDVP